MANLLVMKMLYLQSENRHQDIHLYVNSPGGSVTATLAIYDTMQFIECDVATYCVGLAASGGAVLVAGGAAASGGSAERQDDDPPAHGQVGGQVSTSRSRPTRSTRPASCSNRILADHTGQPIERIAKDTARDCYLNSAASKEYGLVDEIVAVKRDKKKKVEPAK